MSPIAVRLTPTPRQCSRQNLVPRRNENRTPTKGKPPKKPTPSINRSDHGKGANIQITEIVAHVSDPTGQQLQSDVGLPPKKKARQHSPVLASSPKQHRSDCSQDVNNADQSDQDSTRVWHSDHCPNCVALKSINEISFAALQHHYKYCSTYCVFYQLMEDIEQQIMSNENIKDKYKKLSHIYQSEQAQSLCTLLVENMQDFPSIKSESSKRATQLFKKAAKLSQELLGPVDTIAFDCKRYEEYMRLLLEIAQITKADIELIGDIEMYLKPFDRSRIATRSQTNEMNEMKWDETFFDLKHSPEDKDFGSNLKEIAEPESGQERFLKLTGYTKNCHLMAVV